MITLLCLLINRIAFVVYRSLTRFKKGDNKMNPDDCYLDMESEEGVEPWFTGEKSPD